MRCISIINSRDATHSDLCCLFSSLKSIESRTAKYTTAKRVSAIAVQTHSKTSFPLNVCQISTVCSSETHVKHYAKMRSSRGELLPRDASSHGHGVDVTNCARSANHSSFHASCRGSKRLIRLLCLQFLLSLFLCARSQMIRDGEAVLLLLRRVAFLCCSAMETAHQRGLAAADAEHRVCVNFKNKCTTETIFNVAIAYPYRSLEWRCRGWMNVLPLHEKHVCWTSSDAAHYYVHVNVENGDPSPSCDLDPEGVLLAESAKKSKTDPAMRALTLWPFH